MASGASGVAGNGPSLQRWLARGPSAMRKGRREILRMRTSRIFVTLGMLALACTVGRSAHAHGDVDKAGGEKKEGHVEVGGAEASGEGGEGRAEETEKKFEI